MKTTKNYMAPISVKSTVDIVVDRLTQAIIDGSLKAGEKLLPEAELAASFGVGRNTIREAVRILIAYGILEIRRPEGTFVCETFKAQGLNPMLYSMILKRDDSYENLVALRQCIEVGTFHLLSQMDISPELIAKLEKSTQALAAAVRTVPTNIDNILNEDVNFHHILAEATENPLIVSTNEMVVKLSLGSRRQTIEYVMEKTDGSYLIDTHEELLNCIKAKNFVAMCNALEHSYRYWKNINKDEIAE